MTTPVRQRLLTIAMTGALVGVFQSSSAQSITDDGSVPARMPWGEPDLQGTYSRAIGQAPMVCGAHGGIAVGLSPLHSGPTSIDQTPRYIRIRNPFSHTRIVLTDGGRSNSRSEEGRWEGQTLVVQTRNAQALLPANALFERSMQLEHPRVIERFTRLNAETIDYRYSIEGLEGRRGVTISFPLTRTRRDSHWPGPAIPSCDAEVD